MGSVGIKSGGRLGRRIVFETRRKIVWDRSTLLRHSGRDFPHFGGHLAAANHPNTELETVFILHHPSAVLYMTKALRDCF